MPSVLWGLDCWQEWERGDQGAAEFVIQVGDSYVWTSEGSTVLRMGEFWALFCDRTSRVCSLMG